MTKQPNYRFAGYTEPWEEKKLGEFIIAYREKTVSNNQFPVLTSSRRGLFLQSNYYKGNQIASEDNTGYNIVPKGYFTYRHMSDDEIFKFNINDFVDFGIVSTLYPVFTTTSDLDSIYLKYQLNEGTEFKKYAILQKQGGSRTYMYLSKLQDLILSLPSLPEQTAIGSFFQDIDQFISLQQRKLEVLKEQKKTYLKLLFPAKGQTKPALRFAGFEDDWKEVKLGEVTDRYDNLRVPVSANERVSGETPYYGANGIQDYVDGYTHDGEFILIAEDGASDLKDYPVQYVNGKVWVNNHAHVIQGKKDLINNIFLLFAVKQINIEPFLVGGGRAKLNSDIMMKLPLHLPTLPEQQAIGSFFQDLDKAIAKQEEKVNQLKESKQTLLRKMFI